MRLISRGRKTTNDVFLNNNALSFIIKSSSFLTNDDCVFREDDGRYSNQQRSLFGGARVESKALRREMVEKSAEAHSSLLSSFVCTLEGM